MIALQSMGVATYAQMPIIGGAPVVAESAEAKVEVLLLDLSEGGLCTGTIIAPDAIVTAAHCLNPDANGENAEKTLIVGFGLDMSDTDHMTPAKVRLARRHPSYKGESAAVPGQPNVDQNDIAIVLLDKPIPAGFAVAKLVSAEHALVAGEKAVLTGYGLTHAPSEDPMGESTGVLHRAEAKILVPNFGTSEVVLDESHGQGTCSGDSGGGAFVMENNELRLFGVTSRGPNSCDSVGIYTKVSAHLEFLRKFVPSLN